MSCIVLIVDDSLQHASTLEIALAGIPGVEVANTRSGEEALDYLNGENSARVGALVTDLNMPRMDGYELIARLRRDERYRSLPIIAVSGDTDPHVLERAKLAGANAFFAKPYSPAGVRNAVAGLLNGSSPDPAVR